MRAIARWCVQHRRTVLAGWIVALVVVAGLAKSIGSDYKNTFSLNGTQSFEALNLLEKAAPKASGDTEQVVFSTKTGKITDAAQRQKATAVLTRLSKLPTVASVASPFAKGGSAQISSSGTIAFANVTMTKTAGAFTSSQATTFTNAVKNHQPQGLTVAVDGQVAEAAAPVGDSSAGFGALAALIVLFIVLGSFVAALLPLVTAGAALGVGVSLVGLLSHALSMANFSSELALLIGLGVGVDYALFIVTRYRQGLVAGKSVEDAIVDALDTSGRAVMFAGITVWHRAAGHVRARRQLPLRRGHRRRARGRLHGVLRADPAARAARLPRPEDPRPPGAPQAGRRGTAAGRRRSLLGAVDGCPLQPSGADRAGRVRRHRDHRDPVLLAAPGVLGRGLGPGADRRPGSPTTCWPRASGRGTTVRCRSSPRSTRRRRSRRSPRS